MQNAILKHKVGENAYQDYELKNMVSTVGRSSSNDIVIKDTSISRLHIRVENRNGQFYVVDNNSSNGTYLNRRKITEAPLKDGDTIMAGRVYFYFHQNLEPDEAGRTQPLSIMGQEPGGQATISVNLDRDPGEAPPDSPDLPHPGVMPPSVGTAPAAMAGDDDDTGDHDEPIFHAEPITEDVAMPAPPAAAPIAPAPATPAASAGAAPSIPTPPPTMQAAQAATPVQRFLAFLIDTGIMFGVGVVLGILNFIVTMLIESPIVSLFITLLAMPIGFIYYLGGWIKFGKTLGKHFMGLRVVEGNATAQIGISPKAAVLRFIGYLVCAFPMYLGFLYIFVDKEGLGIQDKIANTRVISEK